MVISRRTNRRWTLVRGGSSNAESAVNPTAARRPEEFRYHPYQAFTTARDDADYPGSQGAGFELVEIDEFRGMHAGLFADFHEAR